MEETIQHNGAALTIGWGIENQHMVKETRRLAEKLFGTLNDPNQIPITPTSTAKLEQISSHTFYYAAVDGEPVSWILIIPTTKVLMERYLRRDITEAELFRQTQPAIRYDALYFCSAITLSKYRRRGLARLLFERAVNNIPTTPDVAYFAWPYSKAGEKMIKNAEKKHNVRIGLPVRKS